MVKPSVFLERRSYRQRRVMDAIRLLPFLGVVIWMVPLLWPQPDTGGEGIQTATALRYLFGGWVFLVCAAAINWRRARHHEPPQPEEKP